MIGVPMPNPRDTISSNLERQLEHFFGTGKTVQEIASGVSGESSLSGASGHSERLRTERNKLAPMLKALAATGITSSAAATQTRIRQKRIELIAKENGFRFAATK
ncbi:hypothetical protein [Pseudomonas sp.]|uniref:hypothetical protein n=1 Tax=Pseudomonas sp. TaxID=306 RepID=UPI003265256F